MILCDNCSPRNQCTAEKNRTECKFFQPMTNEEWFCGLDTEEKAKVFASVVLEAWGDGQNDKLPSDKSFTEYWRNWLMEIHE